MRRLLTLTLALAGCTTSDAGTTNAATSGASSSDDTGDASTGTPAPGSSGPDTSSGSTGSSDGGADSSSTSTTGAVTPGYSPFFRMDCDDGQLEAEAVGPDALASAINVVYSDEQALDDVGQSCRTTNEAGENYFGGRYLDVDFPIGDGHDIWMRQALFFPDGFCFGHGTTPDDGWGVTKWMRVEFDNVGPRGQPGDRLTMQLGNFASEGCNESGELWGATREYAGAANLQPPSSPALSSGQWHLVQWHVHLATDETGFVRFWVDDTFLGQADGVTLGSPERQIDFIMYGDYWNGSPFEDVAWFTDEVIMSVETPNTLDAEGNPYIHPDARANDWDA